MKTVRSLNPATVHDCAKFRSISCLWIVYRLKDGRSVLQRIDNTERWAARRYSSVQSAIRGLNREFKRERGYPPKWIGGAGTWSSAA
jgi:hypothetical protein